MTANGITGMELLEGKVVIHLQDGRTHEVQHELGDSFTEPLPTE